MLHVFFPLDCGVRGIENLKINEFVDSVPRRMPFYEFVLVLVETPHEIVRHSDIQGAARTARKVYK
jgi:hypothetical protein